MTRGTAVSGNHAPYQGQTDEWYTPPEIFEALGLRFDLDPCSPLGGPVPWVPARRFLTAGDDGLQTPWFGSAFVNPPYGPRVALWLERLADHGNGIALVFARTDTAWWHDSAVRADAACFIRGRLHFYDHALRRASFNAGAPHVLLGYGPVCAAALERCGLGAVVRFQHRLHSSGVLPLEEAVGQ